MNNIKANNREYHNQVTKFRLDPQVALPASVYQTPRRAESSRTGGRQPSRRGKRAFIACDACHKKKKRCDLKYPDCGNCLKSGVLCSLSGHDWHDQLPAESQRSKQTEELQARVEWLEQILQQRTDIDVSTIETGGPIDTVVEEQDKWFFVPHLVANAAVPEGASIHPTAANGEQIDSASDALDLEGFLSDKLENRRASVVEAPLMSYDVIRLSTVEEAESLVSEYFESLGYQYPFLNRAEFMEEMQKLYRADRPVPPEVKFSYHITVAISMLIGQPNGSVSPTFYHASRAFLGSALRHEGLVSLQALLSLALYSLFSASGPSVWHILGVAMRLATAMGLHKTKLLSSSTDLPLREMEKRAFWSLYALDRLLAVTLHRPLGIADEDITTELPGEYAEDWAKTGGVCAMSIPVHVIKLRRIFSRIYQSCTLCYYLSLCLAFKERF